MWNDEQGAKLLQLLQYAHRRVPYYRELLPPMEEGLTYEQFCAIPLLDKSLIRSRYDDLLAEGIDPACLKYEYTSGSTGIPIRYPRTQVDRLRVSLSLVRRRRRWLGEWPDMDRLAIFSARAEEAAQTERGTWLGLSLRDMSDECCRVQIDQIREYKPQMLQGPAQALARLAGWILDNRVNMEPAGIRLVENRSEYIFEGQRRLIERAFRRPVANMYGAHEFWGIAYECPHQRLHVIGENAFVEVLDANGRPAAPGEQGEGVVTGLSSYAMPLIRYRLGDRTMLHRTPCPCGDPYPYLELLGSRTSEWIRTPKGHTAPVVLRPLFARLAQEFGNIIQFQLIQREIDRFEVRLVSDGSLPARTAPFVQETVQRTLGYPLSVEVREMAELLTAPSGKLSWFFSTLAGMGTSEQTALVTRLV